MVVNDDRRTVVLMAIGFLFLFSGFMPIQNLITTQFPDFGAISLAVLYSAFAFTALFAPGIVRLIGAKPGLIVASLGYVCFISSTMIASLIILCISCVLNGIAAAVLWTSQ